MVVSMASPKVPRGTLGRHEEARRLARAIAMTRNASCTMNHYRPHPIMADVINNLIIKLSSELKITASW